VTARCSYESYVCLSWFDYVTAWCGSSQDQHFTLAHHRASSSSVIEHLTRSRRVVGSNHKLMSRNEPRYHASHSNDFRIVKRQRKRKT